MGSSTDQPDDSEQRGVDEVIDRLGEKYPDVDREVIGVIVTEEHEAFNGRPVRDFVPVLVEKRAKQRVKALVGV